MLEKAIEIEGLLRIIRDGNPMPETYSMLSAKATVLAEDALLLEEEWMEGKAPASEDSVSGQMEEVSENETSEETDKNQTIEIAHADCEN